MTCSKNEFILNNSKSPLAFKFSKCSHHTEMFKNYSLKKKRKEKKHIISI